MDFKNLIQRKVYATLISTSYFIMGFTIYSAYQDFLTKPLYLISNIWVYIFAFSLYTLLIVVIYGMTISIAIEYVFKKFKSKAWLLISGLLHLLFGILGGLLLQKLFKFALMAGIVATLFFVFDELQRAGLSRKMKARKMILITSLLPVLIGLISYALYYPYWAYEDDKFTANDAVKFAVSAKGTYNSLFPSDINQPIEVFIEGYKITRKTKVEKIGRGDYKVTLLEQWEKDEIKGEHGSVYIVQREEGGTSSGGDGSYGDQIPYKIK